MSNILLTENTRSSANGVYQPDAVTSTNYLTLADTQTASNVTLTGGLTVNGTLTAPSSGLSTCTVQNHIAYALLSEPAGYMLPDDGSNLIFSSNDGMYNVQSTGYGYYRVLVSGHYLITLNTDFYNQSDNSQGYFVYCRVNGDSSNMLGNVATSGGITPGTVIQYPIISINVMVMLNAGDQISFPMSANVVVVAPTYTQNRSYLSIVCIARS